MWAQAEVGSVPEKQTHPQDLNLPVSEGQGLKCSAQRGVEGGPSPCWLSLRKGRAGPHCHHRAKTSLQPGRGLFVTFPSLFAVCTQASLGIHSVSLAAGISLASLSPFSRQRPLFLVSYLQFDRVTVTLASYSSGFNRGNNESCLAMNRI